jgi:hypothetical protein
MTLYLPITTHAAPATTHRELWALGDYAAMASEVLTPLGPILLSASGFRSGDRVLDVAAGSGTNSCVSPMTSETRPASGSRTPTTSMARRPAETE